jgi:hypothetical protein
MYKLAIVAIGTSILMLAGCGPQAPNQADAGANAAAPVADPMAMNAEEKIAAENAAAENAELDNAGAGNASNVGDPTNQNK